MTPRNFLAFALICAAAMSFTGCTSPVKRLDSVNQCWESAAAEQWRVALARDEDPALEELYTLRSRLCSALAAGDLNQQHANEQFQAARQAYLNAKARRFYDDYRATVEALYKERSPAM